MLTLKCVHLGEMLHPVLVHGSVGAVYPVRPLFPDGPAPPKDTVTQGGTTPLAVASSPALESAPTVTPVAPSRHWPRCSGGGGTDLHSWGNAPQQEHPPVLCPPHLLLSRGDHRILGCVPQCPGIRGLCCWNPAPGSGSRRQQGTAPPPGAPA